MHGIAGKKPPKGGFRVLPQSALPTAPSRKEPVCLLRRVICFLWKRDITEVSVVICAKARDMSLRDVKKTPEGVFYIGCTANWL